MKTNILIGLLLTLSTQSTLAGPSCLGLFTKKIESNVLDSAIRDFNQLLKDYTEAPPIIKSRLEHELKVKHSELLAAGVSPSLLRPLPGPNKATVDAKEVERTAEKSVLDKQKTDPRTWQSIHSLKYPNTGYSTRLKFTADSLGLIAYGAFYDSVRIIDVKTGNLRGEIKQTAEFALNLSKANEFLISTEKDLMRIDLNSTGVEQKRWQIETPAEGILGVTYSKVSNKIYALLNMGDGNSSIYEVDPQTGSYKVHNLDFTAYEIFLQDGKKSKIILSVNDLVSQYSFLDADTLKVTSTSTTTDSSRYTSGIQSMEFTQNEGQALVVSSVNGKAAVWDFQSNKLISDFGAAATNKVFFHMGANSPSTGIKAVLTFANALEFYDPQNKSLTSLPLGSLKEPHAILFAPNGQYVVIIGEGGNALVVGSPLN